jgi:enoyl-CoA hydratase
MRDFELVRYEALDRVARVTMNRPRYRNAQSRRLLTELDEAFTAAADDPSIRVIILAGEGKDFSAGHDLGTPEFLEEERRQPRQGRSEAERNFAYSWQQFVDMSLRWRDIPKPTIAQVHGWCIFGGWIFASAMDLVTASDDAKFMTNLLQYFTLPWDVGARKAKEILFDNHVITAAEASELGFVNRVWPRDELDKQTLQWANQIAQNATFMLRQFKLSVNQMQDAAGFRAAVQAAHANYHLTEIHNRMREQERGGEPRQARRLDAVDRILAKEPGPEKEGEDGTTDR